LKLSQNLQSSNSALTKKQSELEEKDKEIKTITNKLNSSLVENQKVKQDMIKLQQEQVGLIVKLNDHKTQVNKLAE